MALRWAVVVSHAPGFGGTPSTGQRSTAVANASAAISSAMSRSPKRLARVATTRAHSSRWTRVITSPTSVMLAQERPELDPAVAALRPLGGEPQRHVEVGGLDDPEAGDVLLRLQVRPVGEHRLPVPAVDDGGRAGRREAAGEDPVAVGLELLVEDVDRGHLLRGGRGRSCRRARKSGTAPSGSSPVVVWPPLGPPLTPATNAAAPIRHAPLRFLRGFSYAARYGGQRPSTPWCPRRRLTSNRPSSGTGADGPGPPPAVVGTIAPGTAR